MLLAVGALRQRVTTAAAAFGDVFRTRELRRIQLAWAGSVLGNWSYIVALGVYAYDQGGAAAVGLIGVLRLIPAAVAAPLLSTLADRMRRERVMISSDLLRAGLMVAAGAVIAVDGPAPVVYAIIVVATIAGTVFRPAQAALLPSLVRDPRELSAANVVASTVESVGSFAGPAVGGLLLAFTNPETVFMVNALSFVWSAALVAGVHSEKPVREEHGDEADRPSFLREVSAGMTSIVGEPHLRLLSGLYAAQTLVAGAASVFTVAVALDLLDIGNSGVGWLSAASGLGGFVGGLLALGLAMRSRLATDLALGLVLNGLPFALVAAFPSVPVALAALAIVGIGNSVVDVSAITLLQRAVPDAVLGRVLGAIESILLASLGIGALLAPLLISVGGLRVALLAAGALLPVLVGLSWLALRRIDAGAEAPAETGLLAAIPIFSPLPLQTLERLASQLGELRLPAGTLILRQGDPGDRFYVIAEGEVEIEGRRHGPGAFFGEIALLKDVPRTATVAAATDVRLLTLEREEFIAAVTGHEPSAAAAEAIVSARLGALRPGVAPV
jgi:MFS family permease